MKVETKYTKDKSLDRTLVIEGDLCMTVKGCRSASGSEILRLENKIGKKCAICFFKDEYFYFYPLERNQLEPVAYRFTFEEMMEPR